MEILRAKGDNGVKVAWNAAPEAIVSNAEWFFPYLERFVWSISLMAQSYVIEGVDFLPAQVAQLSAKYSKKSVVLGWSKMTLDRFDQFPGHSRGYANLPEDVKQQFVHDIPLWSEYVHEQAKRFCCPFIDMTDDFASRLHEA